MTTVPSHLAYSSSTSMPSVSQQASMASAAAIGALDEASSHSHASSSRGVAGASNSGTPNGPSRIHFQPLSMADALARAGHDQVRTLDDLLAERNKFCLEASKLSTENMRLWNMMKRIKRENEEMKAGSSNSARNSPLSGPTNATAAHASYASLGSAPSTTSTLPASSTAPTLIFPPTSATNNGGGGGGGLRAYAAPSSLYESATGHSDEEARESSSVSEAHGPSAAPSSLAAAVAGESAARQDAENFANADLAGRRNDLDSHDLDDAFDDEEQAAAAAANAGLGLKDATDATGQRTTDSIDGSSLASQSQQHASIMQQRAAAQAQRLAQLQQHQGQLERPTSIESHEFEAVDGSSVAASDGRSSARASADVASIKRGSAHPQRMTPAATALSSPAQSGRPWSSDSSRNLFSPRLDANLLQFVSLSISGSNLRTGDRGKEVVSFFITVDVDAPPGRVLRHGAWRVEKTYADVLSLDARVKQKHGKTVAKRMANIHLPDQTLFKDHAPSKVDRRKTLLEAYLRTLLALPMPDRDDLCTFLCTDALPIKITDPDALTKEGFLTKKGQNLGRWVTRWYVLSETSLDHYESRGGVHLGSINIRGAQIGRQQKSVAADSDENSYRHAFLILETKPPASPKEQRQIIRHVLCAETDDERDDWVDVLVRAIGEADNRDQIADVGAAGVAEASAAAEQRPSISSPFSAQSPLNGHSATRALERAESEGGSTVHGGPSLMVRSPSGQGSSVSSNHQVGLTVDTQAAAAGGLAVNQTGSIPRSQSEVVGMGSHTGRHGALTASISGGGSPITKQAIQQSSFQATHPTSPPQQHQHPLQYQQQVPYGPRYGSVASPARATARSASQDVASSSSTGHGFSQDSTALRPPSPDQMSAAERHTVSTTSRQSKDRQRPSISGPMNGTPIPTGYKFGKDEHGNPKEPNETKKRFWHRFGGGGDKNATTKKVFGVPLIESIAVSNVSEGLELPSVVYRCIEYLEHRNAALEEGIYRLSGSSAVIKSLKDRFNLQGDVNLLAASEPFYDPHAIAGLLKQYLRELPSSVLTREMHLDFMRVNDITDRRERVNELGSLVSLLPMANYSLLRTLCSHLIKVIERSDVNKMTMRNVGIVFSPTLGIPAGVFALFLTEFDWVFFTDAKGEPAPRTMEEDIIPPDEAELGLEAGPRQSTQSATESLGGSGPRRTNVQSHRNNRNSLSYNEAEADKLLGGPQARNRLSTYLEDFDHAEGEPLEEQALEEAGSDDAFNRGDTLSESHLQRARDGSLEVPWSPQSVGHGKSIRPPPPDMEITSVLTSPGRTPLSPASPIRSTRLQQS